MMSPIPDAQAGQPVLDERDTEHGIPEKEWGRVFEEANAALRKSIEWMEENKDKWVPKNDEKAQSASARQANSSASYRDWETDRKSTRLNSSHRSLSRMPSSA